MLGTPNPPGHPAPNVRCLMHLARSTSDPIPPRSTNLPTRERPRLALAPGAARARSARSALNRERRRRPFQSKIPCPPRGGMHSIVVVASATFDLRPVLGLTASVSTRESLSALPARLTCSVQRSRRLARSLAVEPICTLGLTDLAGTWNGCAHPGAGAVQTIARVAIG